ncbi:MAG: hypothetical protein K8R90_10875 [Candidatus Cloacimonetes bacterium]|nr:hypothetical protein [Candidatus Cloacimonadota bacterium]
MKQLNMTLNYKGKALSYMRQGVDFGRSLRIGSDASLFWQILDDNFPCRHTLLVRSGEGFRLHCRSDWLLQVSGRQETGDVLLRPGMDGTLTLSPDWVIGFAWREPVRHVFTQAELTLRRQYARRLPLSLEQRFTRLFMLLALLATIGGIVLVNAIWPAQSVERDIFDLASSAHEASLVRIQRQRAATTFAPDPVNQPVVESTPSAPTDQPLPSVGDLFGVDATLPSGSLTDINLGAHDLLQVETGATIITVGGSNRHLSSDEATAWFETAPGGAAAVLAADNTGNLRSRNIGVGQEGFRLEQVNLDEVTARAGEYNLVRLETGGIINPAVQERFSGLEPVPEEALDVETNAVGGRGDLAGLRQTVRTYRRQIESLFRAECALNDMHGSLAITLFIAADGTVQDATLQAVPGSSFSDSFVRKAYDMLRAWRLPVKEDTVYKFRMTFMQ